MYKILKFAIGIILIILGLISVFNSAVGGFFILIAGILIIPQISNIIRNKLSFWNEKAVRLISVVGLLFIGFMIIGIQKGQGLSNKKYHSKEKNVIEYIKNDSTDKSLQNIRNLASVGKLFNNENYSLIHPHDGYITEQYDSINEVTLLTFNPRINFSKAKKYLKENENGSIESYAIKFKISDDSIISKNTLITYSKLGVKKYSDQNVPDIRNFLDSTLVTEQRLIIDAEKLAEKQKQEYNKRAENFEKDCLSAWDGSNIKLKRVIKINMNNPDSFEHVETKYRLYQDFAMITMKFRGENAFGGIVLNTVTAKVSLKDCSVIQIEN